MNTIRKLVVITAFASGALALPAHAFWDAWDADYIDDRHPQAIVQALEKQGIKVDRLEGHNELIKGFVVEDDGGTSLQFFDADNGYRRVYPGGR